MGLSSILRFMYTQLMELSPILPCPASKFDEDETLSVCVNLELSSSTSLAAPEPRPGFKAIFNFDESVILKPLEVFQNAIELMSVLSKVAWNAHIRRSLSMTDERFATECALFNLPAWEGLDNDIAVVGLYQTGVAIAERGSFYKLHVGLFVDGVTRGAIKFYPKEPALATDINLQIGPSHPNTTVMANSGRIVDPKDSRATIAYHFDGVKIKAKDIFTSFLNALAIAAEHSNSDLNAQIPVAASAAGEVILSTWVQGDTENSKMTWARLKRGLLIVWECLVINGGSDKRPRFEGFEFELEYDGVKIGAGRLLRFDAAANSTHVTAVAK